MSEPIRHKVACPHSECLADLRIRENSPAGEYYCHCHACLVVLSWSKGQPHLELGATTLPYVKPHGGGV